MITTQQKYNKERNLDLTEEEFSLLVNLYPVIIVAISDGLFDKLEQEYVADISANAALELYEDEKKSEKFAVILFDELKYLAENGDYWKENFLKILSKELTATDKDVLYKMLKETAEVSHGLDKKEINAINEILSLINYEK